MSGEHWRAIKSSEKMQSGDIAFGLCSDGLHGWAEIPERFVGKTFREAPNLIGHPRMVMRKTNPLAAGPGVQLLEKAS